MKGHYISAKEQEFFEKQEYKPRFVQTVSNDWVLSERNHEDHLYIVRCWFEEYVVGSDYTEVHFMNLSETLRANLKVCALMDKYITLFQWLRDCNYCGVEYEHNLK